MLQARCLKKYFSEILGFRPLELFWKVMVCFLSLRHSKMIQNCPKWLQWCETVHNIPKQSNRSNPWNFWKSTFSETRCIGMKKKWRWLKPNLEREKSTFISLWNWEDSSIDMKAWVLLRQLHFKPYQQCFEWGLFGAWLWEGGEG